MQLDALRNSLLEARDRRQALLDGLFPSGAPTTLMLSLNLPGDQKTGERAERLFAWGEAALLAALPVVRFLYGSDPLGPFALYRGEMEARQAKRLAVAVESGEPAGRLLDLDVYQSRGQAVHRSEIGVPPRGCLLCPQPALACIRAKNHPSEALAAQAHMVIDAL